MTPLLLDPKKHTLSRMKLRWGIIGLGGIARSFAKGVAGSKTGQLVAVGSRTQESAERFAGDFGVDRSYPSYEELLADDQVDAVYIATPHPLHGEWVIKAAEAGKQILCEKPLGLNHAEAMAMIEAVVRHDVFLMEAFMYRCHPQTHKVIELIREGAIGQVRAMQGSFGFHAQYDPHSRLYSQQLGGGGVLDVGCYPVSMARLIAGISNETDFCDPVDLSGHGHICETGVDTWAFGTLKFEGDIVAQVGTGVALTLDNSFTIYGSEGKIAIPTPWAPARNGGKAVFQLQKEGAKVERIEVTADVPLFGVEADAVAAALAEGACQVVSPAMSWNDSLGNMRWRAAIGLRYKAEHPSYAKGPLHGRSLARRPDAHMPTAPIPGITLPLSRLVMGCDNQPNMPHAAAMFDEFIEVGGNVFDTAYTYGRGEHEKLLGWWMKHRELRDDVVLICKGAHDPDCFPETVPKQLEKSLNRLSTDRADLYFLHRDNVQVPVGEFVDVLNELAEAGRIGVFGGSNWTLNRVREANDYAARSGKTDFGAVSNQLSLAHMVDPVWEGCLSASDEDYRCFLQEANLALFPWSSQARGFFAGLADPADRSNKQLAHCWYSEDNFQRLGRVEEMARDRDVLPINIALAYVLCQPFPTFPLIGPRTLEELRTSLPAVKIGLQPKELAWLNLEA